MNEAKNYTIDILGDRYTIISDEPAEHVTEAAACVNSIVQEIYAYDGSIDQRKAVVLAALRIASNLIHAEQNVRMMHTEGQKLIQSIDAYLCTAP